MSDPVLGVMRCTREGCGGHLGSSGQEATRLVCVKCGQNYRVCVFLDPIDPKKYDLSLPPSVENVR
jgi:hypothetical protein